MDPATVLSALADLAPAAPDRTQALDVTGGQVMVWLTDPDRASRDRPVERLAAMDVLHRDERLLRRGWAWVLGATEVDGKKRTVRLPLLVEPVRLERHRGGYKVVPAGDRELTPLVTDQAVAADLEARYGDGGLAWLTHPDTAAWLEEAAEAAGLPVEQTWVAERITDEWLPDPPKEWLDGIARAALYVARDVFSGGIADTLRNWAGRDGLADTALAGVYGTATGSGADAEAQAGADLDTHAGAGAGASADADAQAGAETEGEAGAEAEAEAEEVRSPLPLNEAQAEVVRRARRDRVAVVSGPPGSGKSHAVVAAAVEVVDRGGSVLLATQSTHAAEVLGELLERYPGPTPVLFGDVEHRATITAELARGRDRGFDESSLRADEAAVASASAQVRRLAAAVDAALATECLAEQQADWRPLLPALRADAPGAFARDADLAAAQARLDRLAEPATGWWQRLKQRWAERRLRAALGAGPAVPHDQLRAAVEAGRCEQAVAQLAAGGGTDLGPTWEALHRAEADLAEAVGTAMRRRAGSARRWDDQARRTAAALASALRAGRNRRRELLAGMDGAALVRALPLWVGTAADVGELLPPVPGLFDLVILDEASHLDQMRAAPVLARARRALVVGDPRQLRFVSFVADVDVATTLREHGLDGRVDVRRVSAYDLATGAAPVTWLDEHYRSVPHLIEFSATRFYGGELAVATRHPANDSLDVIEVVRVAGAEVRGGVNAAEVDAVLKVVRDMAANQGPGGTGIAVVSPFRAQADALEEALVKEFPVAKLERLALRVGTVHGFQGSEAPVVVASLGLVDGDPPGRARFVADPNLFNVLVTRARERMVVVTSLAGADGVVGDYLAFADRPPAAPDPGTAGGWTGELAVELRRAGLVVRCDYPVGHWTVDLCVGAGPAAYGLVTRVHPDGPAAHRDRQRALARAGWRLVDAFPSRWAHNPARAALDLSAT